MGNIKVYSSVVVTDLSDSLISSVDVWYYLSTSSTGLSGGSWSTTAPSWVDGKYYWQKTITTYADGQTSETEPVCISGGKGNTGSTGTGVESITEEYYLSISKITQSGGSWSTTPPTWSYGKYIWTRSKIVYKNPSSTVYTEPVCDSSWEAVNEIKVGGRNYVHYGKGDVKNGLFTNFDKVENGYGEHTITSKKQHSNINLNTGFILGCRDYEVGKIVVFSYDIMYTEWNFPEGTNRSEWWFGQRYSSQSISGGDTTGIWRRVTAHNLPEVGVDGCMLNEWYHVERVLTIPEQAADGIGTQEAIQLYNSNADVEASVTFRLKNVKLEYGNKATDWTPAPEDVDSRIEEVSNALDASTDVIVGTQTAATGSWTGVAKFAKLNDGQRIAYWLPYAGSGNATLNLTLSNNSTTGAINCYYGGTTRITTHYPAGSVIHLTYRKNVSIAGSSTTYTGWWADANYDSGNTYDRTRYSQAIKAGTTAISSGNIIIANNGAYTHLKLGNAFDVTYPILYASSSISASSTGTNNYLAIPFAIKTTQNITLTSYKPVYIKGTLNGSLFTPISTTPLTQTVPTDADSYQYILLGTAYSTTDMYLLNEHPIFQYYDGAFKSFEQIAMEAANKVDTVTETLKGVSLKVDENEKTIKGKVWQTDITDSINNYDGTTAKAIRDRVSKTETDIDEITSEVSDIKTTVSKKADGSTVSELEKTIATNKQEADGFMATVEKDYATKDSLNNYATTSQVTSAIEQKANIILGTVTDSEGHTTTYQGTLAGLATKVQDSEDRMTMIEQTSEEISLKAGKAEKLAMESKTLSVNLSAETMTVATDTDGNNGSYSSCKTTVSVTYGIDNVTDYSSIICAASNGLTGSWDSSSKVYTITNMTVDNGSVFIQASYKTTIDGAEQTLTADKTFSVSKSKQGSVGNKGDKGDQGVSISKIISEYYLSTSDTKVTGGSWTETPPVKTDTTYIWKREHTLFDDGTEAYSSAVLDSSLNKLFEATAELKVNQDNITGEIKDAKGSSTTLKARLDGIDTSVVNAESNAKSFATQEADRIQSTVTQEYKGYVDGIKYGVRNLLRDTADLTKWKAETGIIVSKEDGWFKVTDSSHNSSYYGIYTQISDYEQNTDYTVSVDIKYGNCKAALFIGYGSFGSAVKSISEEGFGRFEYTFNTGKNTKFLRVYLAIYPKNTNDYGYFKLPKLEKGNRATDWSPDPEDIESTVATVESNITQRADSIELNVSKKKDSSLTAIRYIRDWLKGSSVNSNNHWVECKVMSNNVNIVDGFTATLINADGTKASSQPSGIGKYTDSNTNIYDSDGNIDTDTYVVADGSDWNALELDLGEVYKDIDYIQTWHYYDDNRVYNHKLEVSSDRSKWYTLYDSDIQGGYAESDIGKVHDISNNVINEQLTSFAVRLGEIESNISDGLGKVNQSISTAEGNMRKIVNDSIDEAKKEINGSISELPTTDKVSALIEERADRITTEMTRVTDDLTTRVSKVEQDSDKWSVKFAELGMGEADGIETIIKLSAEGIRVSQSDGSEVLIDTNGLQGLYNNLPIFQLKKDLTVTERVEIANGADFTSLKYINREYQTPNGTVKCLVHVVSGGSS